ncbi:MAG: lysophospholipid acyltransferase family protein [Methylococcaceae bacterium]|jgi:1-acyl-sn-glycerol-3-phosphate acyltransferase
MKSKLRQLYKTFFIIVLFTAGLVIAGLIFPVINFTCNANKAKDHANQLKRLWLAWFARILNIKIQLNGQITQNAALVVANHISWVDIIALGHLIPGYFVSKNDVIDWPVIGYLARQGGTVFIKRGDKQHVRNTTEKMLWLLKQNRSILAFPEGTTSDGNNVLAFHASLFQPAILAKATLQPIAIQYLGDAHQQAPFIGEDAFVSHLLRMLALPVIPIQLTVLAEISTANKKRSDLAEMSRSAICEALQPDNPHSLKKIS